MEQATEHYEETIQLFQQMRREGTDPNKFTSLPILKACSRVGNLEHGKDIHEQIIETGDELDVKVITCLLDMYAKCGSIDDARRVFNKMPVRDVVSWSTMINGYVKCREGLEALELFQQMQQGGLDPDHVTFCMILNACASVAALEEGRRLHEQIIERGFEHDVFVANSLFDMYAKCGRIDDARTVFDKMPTRYVVSWNALIIGCAKGHGQEALELFRRMQDEAAVDADLRTFVGVLTACASMAALEEGKCVHEQIIERGYETDVFVGSCLVDIYAKCRSSDDAQRVFNKMLT